MKVYYCITYYQVLCAILHRLNNFSMSAETCIIISNNRPNHLHLSERIKQEQIFTEVIYLDDLKLERFATLKYNQQGNRGNIDKIITKICKMLELELPLIKNQNNEYFIMSDFKSLGIYLINKKICYNYFEDACGVLSRPEDLLNVIFSKWNNRIIGDYDLNGNNELVLKKYANLNAQIEGFYDPKAVDFNVEKLLKKQDKKIHKKIMNIFEAKKINSNEEKIILVLTQAYIQRNKRSLQNQYKTYANILDYFGDKGKAYIKPHPLDIHSIYSKWFPQSEIINSQIPSDLLSICVEDKIDLGISISSTAINSISGFLKEIIILDKEADNEIFNINKYFAVIQIMNLLKKFNSIICYNISQELLKFLAKKYAAYDEELTFIEEANDSSSITIMNYPIIEEDFVVDQLNDAKKDDIFIFISTNVVGKKIITEDEFKKNCRLIHCIYYDENNYLVKKEEIIVYSKSEKFLKKIEKLDANKKLFYNNLQMKIKSYDFFADEAKDYIIRNLLKQKEMREKE